MFLAKHFGWWLAVNLVEFHCSSFLLHRLLLNWKSQRFYNFPGSDLLRWLSALQLNTNAKGYPTSLFVVPFTKHHGRTLRCGIRRVPSWHIRSHGHVTLKRAKWFFKNAIIDKSSNKDLLSYVALFRAFRRRSCRVPWGFAPLRTSPPPRLRCEK